MPDSFVLAIDQGTTSTRSIVFDKAGVPVASARKEISQHYPQSGWVEHDPEEIWQSVLETARAAIAEAGLEANQIAAIGITNQRETVVIWDKLTGKPVDHAIVWQDRRTDKVCEALRSSGHEPEVRQKSGLLLDPYFSATKAAWILDQGTERRERAERGELLFGTIDTFLIWRLTGGAVHATDVTNASRTLLFDIHRQCWDDDLCALLRVPATMLPQVHDCNHRYGICVEDLFGSPILIGGVAGDQQAAVIGQRCFDAGTAKSTYGTGCFFVLHTGDMPSLPEERLLTTPAYRISGKMAYALEGSIFVAGAAIKWLRDGIGVITHASQSNDMATQVDDNHGVFMVPAFVGLGAPHWRPKARGAIFGLTLDAGAAHLARAALESVVYQTRDLIDSMADGCATNPKSIRIDGGMAANDWLCQFLADILTVEVQRPSNHETTALGAAFLAGLTAGIWRDLDEIRALDQASTTFHPKMSDRQRQALLSGWQAAVQATLVHAAQN